jgi:YHS domain-containing protein
MVRDPVCLKQIDEHMATEWVEYNGMTYYFDSARCREIFETDPADYAGQAVEAVYGDHGHRYEGGED